MMSDTFWQRRALQENVGINAHTHIQTDIVCTYYPRVVLDADCPKTSLHRGAVRFYDPANVGKRLWPCNNPDAYVGGWYAVEPRTGSMLVFEGHVPHDSTYFEGEERMCIPVLCSLDTSQFPLQGRALARSWPIRRKEAAMAYKVGTTIVIDDSGNVDLVAHRQQARDRHRRHHGYL